MPFLLASVTLLGNRKAVLGRVQIFVVRRLRLGASDSNGESFLAICSAEVDTAGASTVLPKGVMFQQREGFH